MIIFSGSIAFATNGVGIMNPYDESSCCDSAFTNRPNNVRIQILSWYKIQSSPGTNHSFIKIIHQEQLTPTTYLIRSPAPPGVVLPLVDLKILNLNLFENFHISGTYPTFF